MNDMMYFDDDAKCFEEAIPLGNGRIGAMIYGHPSIEKIALNEDTIWSGTDTINPVPKNAPDAYKRAKECIFAGDVEEAEKIYEAEMSAKRTQRYMPLGNLYISFGHEHVSEYQRTLDLDTGIASVRYRYNDAIYKREYLASKEHQCIAMKVSSDLEDRISFGIHPDTRHIILKHEISKNEIIICGVCPSDGCLDQNRESVYTYDHMENAIAFTAIIKIDANGGEIRCEDDQISVDHADSAVIYICVSTSYGNNENHCNECKEQIAKCCDFDEIKKKSICDYQAIYKRTDLKLTEFENKAPLPQRMKAFDGSDIGLYELLFKFGRYLTICSSQPDTQASNLQGIWNEDWFPAWNSHYAVNINTEMNYWPTLPCNMRECYEPFMKLIEKIRKTGHETARNFYGANGFVCHSCTDIWGHSNPSGEGARGSSAYSCWNMSSGWLACQMFEYYEYTEDEEVLKNTILPTMEESAAFYLDILTKYNGYYVIPLTTSPENVYEYHGRKCAISKTTTMSMSIVKELFERIIKANEILKTESRICKRVKAVLPELYPFVVGKDGRLLEWSEEYQEADQHHRHLSHLYSLYPGTLISTEKAPLLAEACEKSLVARGDEGTGWSLAWKVNLWAKLGRGDRALDMLKNMLHLVESHAGCFDGGGVYPNMLCAHPPFQIDGNFGVTAGIANMLLQSDMDMLHILPALPKEWKNGAVKGLVAKGNILVSIYWEDNVATRVELTSKKSKTVKIKMNGKTISAHLESGIPKVLNMV